MRLWHLVQINSRWFDADRQIKSWAGRQVDRAGSWSAFSSMASKSQKSCVVKDPRRLGTKKLLPPPPTGEVRGGARRSPRFPVPSRKPNKSSRRILTVMAKK